MSNSPSIVTCDICKRPGITGLCSVCEKWKRDYETKPKIDGKGTALYFEHDQFIGQRSLYCGGYASSSGERFSAYWPNTAYFCPSCGDLWAREILKFDFEYQPVPSNSWVIESRRCAKCGDGYLLIGKENFLSNCSLELLKREALLLCLRNP